MLGRFWKPEIPENVGTVFRNPWNVSQNPEIRKCPRELPEILGKSGVFGFPAAAVCTRGSRILWCFPRQISGFPEIPENVRTVSRDGIFPEIPQGFSRVRGFTAVATYKICKNQSILGVFRDRFPDFRNPEFGNRGHIVHFGISGFRKSLTLKTLFSQKPLCSRYPWGFRGNWDFRFRRSRGHFTHNWQNFRKFENRKFSEFDTFALFFFGAFPCTALRKSENPENPKMTLWICAHFFPKFFRGVFSGFFRLST
jgi:hypothetical protein